MTSNLSQFHYLASTVPNKFDFEADDFDVSQIYQFYSLKVSKRRYDRTHEHARRTQRFSNRSCFFIVNTAPENSYVPVP